MSNPYGSTIYQRNRKIVLEAANYCCQWPGCNRPATTADHIVPLAYGGTNDLGNLRASCSKCNYAGGMRIVKEKQAARRIGRQSRRW
jgi:5-methylcytosine-specific restriction endonuclease McrA